MNDKLTRAGFEERRLAMGAIELNYVVGPNHGPALVLIPAQMGTWESYERVFLPLAESFQVYAVDVRGHGKSSWTTGDYSWKSVGEDLATFLEKVVGRPALVAGNSSGGVLALWLAAEHPERVAGIVLEDAPIFSVEWPRFRDKDRFVYQGLVHAVESIGDVNHRDLADYLRGQVLPMNEGRRIRRMPDWFVDLLSWAIKRRLAAHPGEPVDIAWLPGSARVMFKSLSQFDPDFARAFVDGRFYGDFDHAEALRRTRCPILVLHADWFRHPDFGLVGALDADDVAHIVALRPEARVERIHANHVIHFFKPQAFVDAIKNWARAIG
jgi:pimeloyl-ACP methyl ester carboxylesterase